MSHEEPGGRWAGPRAPFGGERAGATALEGDAGTVAAADVLRRVRRLAAAYGIVAGGAFALAGAGRRGLVLTGAAALSIVALRSLEGVVRRLRAPGAGSSPELATPAGLGLAYPFRLLLLIVPVILLAAVGRDPLALVLGLSAVPLAVLAEAGIQLARGAGAGEGDGGEGGDDGADR